MQIQASLAQRTELGLALLPKVLQSIEVLQLGTAELGERIADEVAHNETLEVGETPGVDPAAGEPSEMLPERMRGGSDFDPGAWRKAALGEYGGAQAMLESLPAAGGDSLLEHVREQMVWADLPAPLAARVLELAELLDSRGYLTVPAEELEAILGPELLGEALAVLQSFEPRGLGAGDAIEALLLQIPAQDPDRPAIRALLTEHLEAVACNKIPDVARRMRLRPCEVVELVDRIRGLDPHPGSRFCRDAARPVRPDVVVSLRDEQIEVQVEDHDLPSLGINEDYTAMAQDPRMPRAVKTYLRPKLESARNLIFAVEQRRRTVGRVAAAVMEYQRAFLEHGRTALRPLKMADIADQLGLHSSTVSRAVAGKYVQTPRGIVALRDFFDGGRGAGGAMEGPGRLGVQERLRQLVAAEAPHRPLSDDELASGLARDGTHVARRTVAKYRRELGIPSSFRRRRFGPDQQEGR